MLMPTAVSGAFLLINLLGVVLALGIGFGAGAWFLSARTGAAMKTQDDAESKRDADRTLMASSRLVDLAHTMASDVDSHTSKIKSISADLEEVDRHSLSASTLIANALDRILVMNAELHVRLESAEKQIEAQAAEIRVHESEARTDSLTGLANRRAFDDELKRRLSEWERRKTPFCLLLTDIDHFKRFNDLHGHQVGDEVLRRVAKTLTAQSREMDVPCRYGGEEFAIILPATNMSEACVVAERVRKAVDQSTIPCDGQSLTVTASIGLAMAAENDNAFSLIRRADEALYKSKESGRNCGHWHDCEKCIPVVQPAKPEATSPTEIAPKAASTRVASRATFVQELKRRATESQRFGVPVSIICLKLSEYELVLNRHGVPAAQMLLGRATQALEDALRDTDILSQHEQGEFMIMLPGSTEPEARQMVKRMKLAASQIAVELSDCNLPLKFQHGIAQLRANESVSELLARGRSEILPQSSSNPALHS